MGTTFHRKYICWLCRCWPYYPSYLFKFENLMWE
nr:MAG TPA: Disulfide-rich peptide [Caudoviricetes sp.]